MTRVQALPKQPPHAVEPEQMVLGGLMLDGHKAVTVFGLVSPDDFYRADHRVIAQAIRALHEARKSCDYVAVVEALRDAGQLENAGGPAYVAQLQVECYSTGSIEDHARIVRDKAQRRQVIALCADVADAAYRSDASDLAGLLSAGVEKLLRAQGSRARKFSEWLVEAEAYLKLARDKRRAGGVIGVPSGLPSLDKALSGFWGGRLYGVAARPGTGKTALLNQIAFYAAHREHGGYIASLEMGGAELIIRALSSYSGQNVGRLFHGYEAEGEAAIATAARMGDLPLWIDTDTYSLHAIVAQIAAHKHRYGIKWAAIDHVGHIQTEKFQSRNDQIGHITHTLKRAAKDLGIPIIALFQLSRANEKESRKPSLHDLRDSGNIEQDLDVAMFLHVDANARGQAVRPVSLGILKDRTGKTAWLDGLFQFDGGVQTFREVTTAYERPYHEAPEVPL